MDLLNKVSYKHTQQDILSSFENASNSKYLSNNSLTELLLLFVREIKFWENDYNQLWEQLMQKNKFWKVPITEEKMLSLSWFISNSSLNELKTYSTS